MANVRWKESVLRNYCPMGIHDECTGKVWIWVWVEDECWSLKEAWDCQCACHS